MVSLWHFVHMRFWGSQFKLGLIYTLLPYTHDENKVIQIITEISTAQLWTELIRSDVLCIIIVYHGNIQQEGTSDVIHIRDIILWHMQRKLGTSWVNELLIWCIILLNLRDHNGTSTLHKYHKISNKRRTKPGNLSDCPLVFQLPLANPLKPGWEWRCSDYIWLINNFIANSGAACIRGLTVMMNRYILELQE